MFFRALLACLALPGLAAIVVPLCIAYFDTWRGDTWLPGGVGVLAGAVILLWCVRDFYETGKGTLAPWEPPKQLVVVGLYRFVRNPMYVGVVLLVLGWSILFQSVALATYAFALFVAFHLRVIFHEEPWLDSQFPKAWRIYRMNVRRWVPRLTPWHAAA